MIRIGPQRSFNPDAISVPDGYRVEALITGLSFPSAISFGPGGEIYLAEAGGVAGQLVAAPRVLRIDPDRSVNEIGRLADPIVGLLYRNGELLIGEDSPSPRILRVTAEGELRILVDGLHGGGDYGLTGLSSDPSGAVLFGVGVRTNSGVVGLDNVARGWVNRFPDRADQAGDDVELAGLNFVTTQPGGYARTVTGGFKPFGHRAEPGEKRAGSNRAGGAVYRVSADGADVERLASGLRNPIGAEIGPDGKLFVTEGGMEERGSRPIAGASDNLWSLEPGAWCGWPDYASGVSVTDPRFRLPGHPQPRPLLAAHPSAPPTPFVAFPARAGVGRLDFSGSAGFGIGADPLVALSGEWSSAAYPTDSPSAGCRVVRVNMRTGEISDFLSNKSRVPSSSDGSGGLERPYDVRFDPTGEVLYVVDMGEVLINRDAGLEPIGGTGVVWRISRARRTVSIPPMEVASKSRIDTPNDDADFLALDPFSEDPDSDEIVGDEVSGDESTDETGFEGSEIEWTAEDTESLEPDIESDTEADPSEPDADVTDDDESAVEPDAAEAGAETSEAQVDSAPSDSADDTGAGEADLSEPEASEPDEISAATAASEEPASIHPIDTAEPDETDIVDESPTVESAEPIVAPEPDMTPGTGESVDPTESGAVPDEIPTDATTDQDSSADEAKE